MTNEKFTLNAEMLSKVRESILTSKEHIEFLAANAPEIRTNLQSIAETLESVVRVFENRIYFNRANAAIVERLSNDCELEMSCKNQAYDFILTERLLNRFKLFCSSHPVSTYYNKTGCDIISK